MNGNVIANPRQVADHPKIRALEMGFDITGTHRFFEDRLDSAVKVADRERHRLADATQGQLAVRAHRHPVFELDGSRAKTNFGMVGRIEPVLALEVGVPPLTAHADRVGINDEFDAAIAVGKIKIDLALDPIETPPLGRKSEVIDLKGRQAMLGIDGVALGLRLQWQGQHQHQELAKTQGGSPVFRVAIAR